MFEIIIWFLFIFVLFSSTQINKSYILDDNFNSVFDKTLAHFSSWDGIKIMKVNREEGILEFKTKMSLYALGQHITVTFKPITANRFEVNFNSKINYNWIDFWGTNSKNVVKFEEQMGLKPCIATYFISS